MADTLEIITIFYDLHEKPSVFKKFSAVKALPNTDKICKADKKTKSQDVIIHWNF